MDNNEICKKPHEPEKLEIARRGEDKAFCNSEIEEGEFRKDIVASVIKPSPSVQMAFEKGQVNTRRSSSPERGSHQGGTGTANITVTQSGYSSIRGQPFNVRQSTSRRIYSEKHSDDFSPSSRVRSKERHEHRTQNCFSYRDYHHVLKKIEEVCSERLSNLLLNQNKDRNDFNVSLKKQEFKFFQEHACCYRVHYERVIPTARYRRMKLPKQYFCILRKFFRKYMQSQLVKFVKTQINDRNKEKRKKEWWIFEAKAGYLKKCFDETSLTYSGFEMEKSNWHVHAYSEGEQQLKYLDMQSLTTEIEAIASSRELEESHKNKERGMFQPEPIVENLQSPLETNGGAKNSLSVDAPEQTTIVDSMSSQSNDAPIMKFSEKVGTQVTFSSPLRNEEGNGEKSCSRSAIDEALVLDKATAADSETAPPVFGEKQRSTSPVADALEGSFSKTRRKFMQVSDSNIHETTLCHEESQAERLPSVNMNQMEQPDTARSKEVSSGDTSSFGQVTEQQNAIATSLTLVQPSTQPQICDPTCQSAARPYELSGVNTCLVSSGLDIPGASNGQKQSANRTPTSSMVEHIPESGLQSDPVTNEFNQLLTQLSSGTSSQVTEQQIASSSFSLTQHARQQYGDQTCQNSARLYIPSGIDNYSVQARLDSPRASHVQLQSNNQTATGSTSEQYIPESCLQSDPLKIEMSRLILLRDLMTKKHISRRQKIISECEAEMAECKRKFDEQFRILEMEALQKKKDIEILQEKVCRQQTLAETLQALHKASTGATSCSQRANTLGRSATNLTHGPSGLAGAGIVYHGRPPHLQAFANQLRPHGGAASFDRQLQL
ncbi:hypothetical protein HU200_013072 [Digitaria exilis]|uniref:Uncharacterized protein n=1 Tax=Digitaria exilis TaxID=1010633 RepID=A0A835FD77_9POAL|nr:hypothetical protein HU200_013072 [Digitaria exilis]